MLNPTIAKPNYQKEKNCQEIIAVVKNFKIWKKIVLPNFFALLMAFFLWRSRKKLKLPFFFNSFNSKQNKKLKI